MRLARDNTGWGYTKIRDVMASLGHAIGRTTIKRMLDDDGIMPAPERLKHMPWATFLKAHWGAIAAMDFFQVEVMTLRGPVRYAVLVVMDLDGTELLDSSGLESLLNAQRGLREDGGELKISTTNVTNRKILEITRLDNEFEVYESVIDAVKSYS